LLAKIQKIGIQKMRMEIGPLRKFKPGSLWKIVVRKEEYQFPVLANFENGDPLTIPLNSVVMVIEEHEKEIIESAYSYVKVLYGENVVYLWSYYLQQA